MTTSSSYQSAPKDEAPAPKDEAPATKDETTETPPEQPAADEPEMHVEDGYPAGEYPDPATGAEGKSGSTFGYSDQSMVDLPSEG